MTATWPVCKLFSTPLKAVHHQLLGNGSLLDIYSYKCLLKLNTQDAGALRLVVRRIFT